MGILKTRLSQRPRAIQTRESAQKQRQNQFREQPTNSKTGRSRKELFVQASFNSTSLKIELFEEE